MCDASEVGKGTLDAVPQVLRPAETPSHRRHVLVHQGEPWGHSTATMKWGPSPSAPLCPRNTSCPLLHFLLLLSPYVEVTLYLHWDGEFLGNHCILIRSKKEWVTLGRTWTGSEDRGPSSALPLWFSDFTSVTFNLAARQNHLGAL